MQRRSVFELLLGVLAGSSHSSRIAIVTLIATNENRNLREVLLDYSNTFTFLTEPDREWVEAEGPKAREGAKTKQCVVKRVRVVEKKGRSSKDRNARERA
jgi:hypothetical protein